MDGINIYIIFFWAKYPLKNNKSYLKLCSINVKIKMEIEMISYKSYLHIQTRNRAKF